MQVMVGSTLGVPLVNYDARFRDLFSMEKLCALPQCPLRRLPMARDAFLAMNTNEGQHKP